MESKIHKEIFGFATLASSAIRASNIRSAVIFEGSWNSISWSFTQRQRDPSKRRGKVSSWSLVFPFRKGINQYSIGYILISLSISTDLNGNHLGR